MRLLPASERDAPALQGFMGSLHGRIPGKEKVFVSKAWARPHDAQPDNSARLCVGLTAPEALDPQDGLLLWYSAR